MSLSRGRFALAAALTLATCQAARAEFTYTITDLGTLGGTTSVANGINATGQVVGDSWIASDAAYHPFLYSGSTMIDIGTLGGNSSAAGINARGQLVGRYVTTNGYTHAFLYTGAKLIDLGTLGGPYSYAYGINDEGQVVGGAHDGEGNYHAFLYSPGGHMSELELIPGGIVWGLAWGTAINNAGQVAGVSPNNSNYAHAFLSSALGPTQDLGTLGGLSSTATGINASGRVVGYADTSGQAASHAFLYDSTMHDLGTLGGTNSVAYGINASGQIVGQSNTAGNTAEHAFLYSGSAMMDLNALIAPSSGWTLRHANGVNDAGQIVGYGTNPAGYTHAFLLTPVPQLKSPIYYTPTRLNVLGLPTPTPGATGLVFITHGFNDNAGAGSWAQSIASTEEQSLVKNGTAANWNVVAYDWSQSAAGGDPVTAADIAAIIGSALGKALQNSQYQTIHLVAHSAGAWMINSMADQLRGMGKTVDVTFLDAFVPWKYMGSQQLGASATFAEQYMDTRLVSLENAGGHPANALWANGRTGMSLAHVANFDVTQLDPQFLPSVNPLTDAEEWHAWPHGFYNTSTGTGFGIDLSPELGSVPNAAVPPFKPGSTNVLSNAVPSTTADSTTMYYRRQGPILDLSSTGYQFGESAGSQVLGSNVQFGTHSPNWFATLVAISDLSNIIDLDLQFTSATGAEGLLTIYWDGTQIGSVDERYVLPGMQHYCFDLPGTYDASAYTLAFRLDPFTNTPSSVQIDHVAVGFVGEAPVPEPATIATLSTALVGLLRRRHRKA